MERFARTPLTVTLLAAGLALMLMGCGGKKEKVPRLDKDKWATDFYAVDVTTTATYKRWIPGSKPLMPQDVLKQRIIDEIGGKKQLYVIATVMNDRVASTVVEMVLDPEQMVLYGLAERDTELALHLQQNPITSINYHREFPNDWNEGICFQMRGRATLYPGPFPEGAIPPAVKRFHQLYSVQDATWISAEARDATSRAITEKLIVFTVPVEQLVYHNGGLPFENYNMRQLWSRNW
jgi:hypothetical protein